MQSDAYRDPVADTSRVAGDPGTVSVKDPCGTLTAPGVLGSFCLDCPGLFWQAATAAITEAPAAAFELICFTHWDYYRAFSARIRSLH